MTFDRIVYDNGLISRCMGDVLGFSPPLIVTGDDVDEIARLCGASLKQLEDHLAKS
jgi:4-aminobutyrate--pyruvate transaminase